MFVICYVFNVLQDSIIEIEKKIVMQILHSNYQGRRNKLSNSLPTPTQKQTLCNVGYRLETIEMGFQIKL
jgi:hypothetical protein